MALTVEGVPIDEPRTWPLRLQGGARYACWVVAALAAAGLAAWLASQPALGALGADFPPILPSGIAVLGATAGALAALNLRHGARARAFSLSGAAVVAAIGALGLLQQAGQVAGGVDLDWLPHGYWVSGSTSLGTALTYLMLAAALALAPCRSPRLQRLSRAFAVAVGAVGLVAVVGLSFRLVRFDVAVPSLGMALPTALALLAAAFGLVFRDPPARLRRLLERDSPGVVIAHRLLPAAVALPLLVGWAQAFGQRSGWYDIAAGEGAVAVLTILACTVLVLWTSAELDDMHRRRARAERREATQRKWLEVTLANIDDAVIAADRAGRAAFLNAAAERLLGVDGAAVTGRPVASLLSLVDEASGRPLACPLGQSLAEGGTVAVDGEPALCGPAGAHAVEVRASPIHDADGRLTGGVVVLRDAGARRARERAMREAYAQLDRRVAERTEALERAGTALRESTALLRTFAAYTPELIFAKDREGRITMVNPAALRALGLARADVIGRNDLILFGSPEDAPRIRESDRRVIETGESVSIEQGQDTPAGRRTYLVTKSPVRDDYGQVLGLVAVATDITEHTRVCEELEEQLHAEHRMRGEAERASRAKDEFLAIVSHELRTPLNALKGWSHVLSGTQNPDPVLVTRATEAIKRNVEHQARLIDDLLDTSRIISGKLELERRPVNLVEVVQTAIDLSRSSATTKRIELRFAADHPVVTAEGDAGRLRQVVVNLLSNGIKFTPEGGVVDLALRRVGEVVELEVSDTGMGIEADFLPHVFDRFSQADASTRRRHSGLGIGLALVRHLVDLHGGRVRVASAGGGRGTTFTVELPAPSGAGADAPAAVAPGRWLAGDVLGGINVLAVDDDPDAREVIGLAIEQAGGCVRCFASGRALVAALGEAPPAMPAVLLLDIAMPGEDGFSVLARVRALPGVDFIPAIAVTALSHLDRGQFVRAGFQDCLAKPVEIGALVRAVIGTVRAPAWQVPDPAAAPVAGGGTATAS